MNRSELIALRESAGNLTTRNLRDAVESRGYTFRRTRGSHHAYTKPGARTLIVQEGMTAGTARGIINRLIRELEA